LKKASLKNRYSFEKLLFTLYNICTAAALCKKFPAKS